MRQAKFSVTDVQMEFLSRHKEFGYKDKSQVVRLALERFQTEIDRRRLDESAELYAQVYEGDSDLRKLTEAALGEWPK